MDIRSSLPISYLLGFPGSRGKSGILSYWFERGIFCGSLLKWNDTGINIVRIKVKVIGPVSVLLADKRTSSLWDEMKWNFFRSQENSRVSFQDQISTDSTFYLLLPPHPKKKKTFILTNRVLLLIKGESLCVLWQNGRQIVRMSQREFAHNDLSLDSHPYPRQSIWQIIFKGRGDKVTEMGERAEACKSRAGILVLLAMSLYDVRPQFPHPLVRKLNKESLYVL